MELFYYPRNNVSEVQPTKMFKKSVQKKYDCFDL